jgi:uncharacterized membrane protein YedE/YeeE
LIVILITLLAGLIIGFLGQRSRFCIISGIRDRYLLKDSSRIMGLFGLLLGAAIGFVAIKFLGGDIANYPMVGLSESPGYLTASIIGGVGLGFFSVLAEGCPFRQHVMAAEGRQSAMLYLMGFYIGIVYFYLVTIHFLELILKGMG